ncbi:MAG: class I SAM-dependent methyltransferase [Candidatus Riflebacteria bacterium]|nr:class I SAM-dependent methyltransferase [Candidatus Riflebacteria bacterium]
MINYKKCIFCNSSLFKIVHEFSAPPAGETRYSYLDGKPYYRRIKKCTTCSHFFAEHDFVNQNLYSGEYLKSVYGDLDGISERFSKVMNLSEDSSDNRGRVKFINSFFREFRGLNEFGNRSGKSADMDCCINVEDGVRRIISEYSNSYEKNVSDEKMSVLDVGSGTGVFPFLMKESGWNVTASDPDGIACRHLTEKLQIKSVQGKFEELKLNNSFDLITFNKVIEHVIDPVGFLDKTSDLLDVRGGWLYIEVPDGEMASKCGYSRQEFFIDHFHVFSMASVALLANKHSFDLEKIERLREPSGKFTIRAFFKRK